MKVEEYWNVRGKYHSPRSHYSDEDVKEMKKMVANGLTQWEVAGRFGCTQSLVSRIVRGMKYNKKPLTVSD